MSEGIAGEEFFRRLIGFPRFLRSNGFLVGPEETADMFRALQTVDLMDGAEVRMRLRTVLCSKREDQEMFDELFQSFFQNANDYAGFGAAGSGDVVKDGEKGEAIEINNANMKSSEEASEIEGAQSIGGEVAPSEKDRSFLQAVRESRVESKQNSPVRISLDNMDGMQAAARLFVTKVRLKPERRRKEMKNGRQLEFRRTLRRGLATGGYPIEPVWEGHPKQQATFVLLCDGSRSMLSYAEVFLQFAYALTKEAKHVELFLFSTRLKRVTPLLKTESSPTLTGLGSEWGGGTKIGESLASFVHEYGPRTMTRRTIVMIFSDGLDTGSTDQLAWAMKSLQRRSHTVIWLNPLAAHDGYEPSAGGMKTALPYIDVFSEAQDAASFQRLANNMAFRRDTVARKP